MSAAHLWTIKTNNQQKRFILQIYYNATSALFSLSFYFLRSPQRKRKNRKTTFACNFSLIEDKGQNYAFSRKKVETRNTHIFHIKRTYQNVKKHQTFSLPRKNALQYHNHEVLSQKTTCLFIHIPSKNDHLEIKAYLKKYCS